LDATTETLRHAAEDTPSGAAPEDVETVPVFDRADLAPKIWSCPQYQWNGGMSEGMTMMVVKKRGVIIETPTEARQAEPGPSVLLLLVVSLSIAVIVMGLAWFVFFRT
jgi:hypothetical protein